MQTTRNYYKTISSRKERNESAKHTKFYISKAYHTVQFENSLI